MKLGVLTMLGVLALASPAQAQTKIEISCSAVTVEFRTSIQPDSATVEITSDAGTETHSPVLSAGGTETVSYPLDGQNGESVSVKVTLVYRGMPNVQSASETLEGCAAPAASPSPSPSPSPIAMESPAAPVVLPAPSVTPPEPAPVEEEVLGASEEKVEPIELPAELAFTGPGDALPWLVALVVLLVAVGLTFRYRARRIAADEFVEQVMTRMKEVDQGLDRK